ncbi:putative cytochrome P450 120 [Dissostichus eleginoides]|uniref:Cytochrome P450 120 n=1 Tax=Dissostichus eleginoides TaxID=100907 RepID=A0AAD9BH29_DISEL|nr:putative cytochrome P450 120 [Dissostichus eleginoides]
MSKLPGNAGVSVLGDKSLEFYRDPVHFCRQRVENTGAECSKKSNLFLKDPTDLMTNMYGDTVITTNGEERLGTELVLGLFLNVRAEEQPELFQEISQLCTLHWHGLISAPVSLKVPLWSSGYSTALDARDKLMDIIKDKLENDKQGFVGSLGSLPLPDSSSASQHLLLFISALIPKALASLLTSFTLALSGDQQQTRRQLLEDPDYLRLVLLEVQRLWPPFIGGRRIADKDSTLAGFHVPKDYGAIYISHSVHRDPEVFQQPDDFLPERWSGRNAGQEHFLCSFGNGPRNCIGTKLTDVFLKEACMYLLNHYDWCLDPPSQDLEYKWLPVSRPANTPTVSFTQLDQTPSDRSNDTS